MDVDGKITFWNEAAVTMSGVAADQAIGRPLTDTMRSGMTSEQVHAFLARALSGEKVNDVEARIESSAGKHYEVLTSAIALYGVGGQPDQVVCISQDRTVFYGVPATTHSGLKNGDARRDGGGHGARTQSTFECYPHVITKCTTPARAR